MEIHQLGQLFETVQMNNVFPDGKTFPDCYPKTPLEDILQHYTEGVDLKAFVHQYFDEPSDSAADFKSDMTKNITEHIHALWDVLTRQPDSEKNSLIPLPHPYIVPGGRFREIYYWDSYFTMLGLQVSKRVDMIENMVENFTYLLNHVGHIPNGNRSYYVGRSQPPFYAMMVKVLSEEKGKDILIQYLPALEKEYAFWMTGKSENTEGVSASHRVVHLPDGAVLNRYWDENNTPRPESYKEDVEIAHNSTQAPEVIFRHLRAAAESGWDFSSRWFKEVDSFASIHTTDLIPVDLNCLLYNLEETISEAYELLNNSEKADFYKNLSKNRQKAIEKYCWNEAKGFYFDYDFIKNEQTEHFTLAATFPLFFKIATEKQAEKVAFILEKDFFKSGGLTTTLHNTGQQWDAPNGWAPLQWIGFKGLMNYGFRDLANQIKANWIAANVKIYEKTGKMTEKYNVFDQFLEAGGGEYPLQDGFGWSNGVFLALQTFK